MDVTIWHNPRCSKSREALALIQGQGIEPRVVQYLKEPPTAKELGHVLTLLRKPPLDLIRTKEQQFTELGLGDGHKSQAELINAMVENPILIERPIVFSGNRAVVGRPPEAVLEVLS